MDQDIKKLRFLDSYRFFTKGLADVAKSLKEFPILDLQFEFENTELLKAKGFYPYEYIDSIEKLDEKCLPSIENFYSTLKQKKYNRRRISTCTKCMENF
jgi:hypothetical protein